MEAARGEEQGKNPGYNQFTLPFTIHSLALRNRIVGKMELGYDPVNGSSYELGVGDQGRGTPEELGGKDCRLG